MRWAESAVGAVCVVSAPGRRPVLRWITRLSPDRRRAYGRAPKSGVPKGRLARLREADFGPERILSEGLSYAGPLEPPAPRPKGRARKGGQTGGIFWDDPLDVAIEVMDVREQQKLNEMRGQDSSLSRSWWDSYFNWNFPTYDEQVHINKELYGINSVCVLQ